MKRSIDLMVKLRRVGLLFVFSFICTFSNAQDASAEIKAAQKLLDQDKKKAAVAALQKAISTYPEATQLYYYLGRAQIIAGDKAGAKASFDAGVAKNPKEPMNIVGQGHILILDKNVTQAKLKFEEALKLGKKNVAAMNAIGEAYLADKAYQKDAMDILLKAKSIGANAQTHVLLGNAHSMVLGQGGAAASAYEHALEADPKCAMAEFMLGELFMSTNLQVAEEHYQKAVVIDPYFAGAHRELGELYYKKKDGQNAAKHYKKYLDLTDSPASDDRFKYAFFLFMAKDFTNANNEFDALIKKGDASSITLKYAAQAQLKAGNLPEAERIFELYLKHPDTKVDADDLKNLGDLRIKQNKDSLAMVAYESSVALDQTQNDLLQTLIKYYFDKKKYPDAERVCRTSIKARKTPFSNDYFNLGRSLYFQKKYVNSDSAFAKLNELQPKFVLGFIWTARSKGAQDGDISDPKSKIEWLAKPAYEKVIEIGEADKEKNKKELLDAYGYLMSHHLYKQEIPKGKEFLNKILEIDPENAEAKKLLKELNNPQPQQKTKKK
jgi:tetratricopeptide (TPR) repeat protein